MSSSNVVKKKKRWGKVYAYTPVKRSGILSEEVAKDIEKELKKNNVVTTPSMLAQRFNIKVSLAKQILESFSEDGNLNKVFQHSKYKIYTK